MNMMKIEVTEKEMEAEALAAHMAEMLLSGAISEDEYHALVATWKLRN
jgi:hypothetical protein